MAIDYNAQRIEAISRLRELGISPEIIQDFEENGRIYMAVPPSGNLQQLKTDGLEDLHRFEKEKNFVFYLAVRALAPMDETDAYLCVGPWEKDWELERAGITDHDKGIFAYVSNRSNPKLSNFNFIWIDTMPNGGIIQVASGDLSLLP